MSGKKSAKKKIPKIRLTPKPLLLIAGLAAAVAAVAYFSWPKQDNGSVHSPPQASQQESDSDTQGQAPAFNKERYSINDPASLWVVVNKGRRLPGTYQPAGLTVPDANLRYSSGSEMRLRPEAAAAVEDMFEAAADDSLKLMVASGFRSYGLQVSVFNRYVSQMGQAEAEKISARPGHSEHQTGLAVDVAPTSGRCLLEECFGDLAEGKWIAKNSYKFGFIVRYPSGKEKQTGYSYEPWHLRYVGEELAGEINKSGQTLEQFFGLPAYSTYPADITEL